jgi:GR25 family glycosyltransferase involved in LPS biosynthesis
MYTPEKYDREIDRSGQKTIYGRYLVDGEIGCAISHQNVYRLVSELGKAAVILEDDARIPSLEDFEKLATYFVSEFSKGSRILSLLPWRHEEKCRPKNDMWIPHLFSLIGTTPLTVGYALTVDAARDLAISNRKIKFLADWPPSSVQYLSSIAGVINHGDQESGSLINSPLRNQRITRTKRVADTFALDFLRNFRAFNSYSEYFSLKIAPSFKWRIDNFRASRLIKELNS